MNLFAQAQYCGKLALRSLFLPFATMTLILGISGCGPHPSGSSAFSGNTKVDLLDSEFIRGIVFQKHLRPMIKVVDSSGKPIGGAQILIGMAPHSPMADNVVVTGSDGAALAPETWTGQEAVTVDARGYVRATYLGQAPKNLSIALKKAAFAADFELRGETLKHPIVDFDTFADFGLILKALTRETLFNLQIESIISPKTDPMTVLGQTLQMPSNLTLPTQREKYVVPITLSKPKYRFYFDQPGPQLMMAAKGRFPLKTVVDQVRAGVPTYKLINYFSFLGGSIKNVDINGAQSNVNFDVSEITYSEKNAVHFIAPDEGKTLLVSRLGQWNAQQFFPADLKLVEKTGSVILNRWSNKKNVILGALKNADEFRLSKPGADRLSAAIVDDSVSPNFEFLPLLENPLPHSLQSMTLPEVSFPYRPDRVMVYASVGKVVITKDQNNQEERTYYKEWEVFSDDLIERIQLPDWKPMTKDGTYRWEAIYAIGRNGTSLTSLDTSMDNISHVTRSSVDF